MQHGLKTTKHYLLHYQSKTLLNIIKLHILERNLHILCFKVLIKNLKTQMISENVALWDISIALWVIFLFIAINVFFFFFFSDAKNVLFDFQLA